MLGKELNKPRRGKKKFPSFFYGRWQPFPPPSYFSCFRAYDVAPGYVYVGREMYHFYISLRTSGLWLFKSHYYTTISPLVVSTLIVTKEVPAVSVIVFSYSGPSLSVSSSLRPFKFFGWEGMDGKKVVIASVLGDTVGLTLHPAGSRKEKLFLSFSHTLDGVLF